MTDAKELDPIYFGEGSWNERLNEWLRERSPQYDAFYRANESQISSSILEGESVLRMVVNIPADALVSFIAEGRYQNTYERKGVTVGDDMSAVNPRRRRVDEALFGSEPHRYYYGAVALGGCGVRFYGEYCMVLRADAIPPDTGVIDRNSWDIDMDPLDACEPREVIDRLTGTWQNDLVDMTKLKVLPRLADLVRLATTGTIADAVLHDESFIEVHKKGPFGPTDLYEIRESVAGPAIAGELGRVADAGGTLTLDEQIWLTHRERVHAALEHTGLRLRIIETSGRIR